MISNIHTCEFRTLMWSLIHLWNFTKLIQFRNQNEELQQNNNDHAYINGIDLIAELKKKKILNSIRTLMIKHIINIF